MKDEQRGIFVSGTGTGVGKTWVSRGIARAIANRGQRIAALKPIETGVEEEAQDALALEAAARSSAARGGSAPYRGRPRSDDEAGFYRAKAALAPYAAALEGESLPLPPRDLALAIEERAANAEIVLVEGIGGLFVPLDASHTVADLALALRLPVLIIAPDRLGVLSDAIAVVELAQLRGLEIAAVVLTRMVRGQDAAAVPEPADDSTRTNQRVLAERFSFPVLRFDPGADATAGTPDGVDDESLARAATASGLLALLPRR